MRTTRVAVVIALETILFASHAFAQDAQVWQPTLDAARKLAGQSNRLILIYFQADWCKMCRAMERDTLSQPAVMNNLQGNFVCVKINADFLPKTAERYGVNLLPTTVVTTADGQMVDKLVGAVEAQRYVASLNQVAMVARRSNSSMLAQVPGGAILPNAGVAAMPSQALAAGVSPRNPPYVGGAAPSLPAPVGAGMPQNPTGIPTASNDRYADYFKANGLGPAAASPAVDPRVADPRIAPVGMPPFAAPSMASNPPAVTPPVAAPADYAKQAGGPAVPAANAVNPPVGLEGYCPVQLAEQQRWVPGDRRWGLVHGGRTYLFSGPAERDRFNAAPESYAPVMGGNDIVLAIEQGQSVLGRREHGVFCGKRVYLFADEASLKRFEQNPAQYANQALQAMRSSAIATGQTFR